MNLATQIGIFVAVAIGSGLDRMPNRFEHVSSNQDYYLNGSLIWQADAQQHPGIPLFSFHNCALLATAGKLGISNNGVAGPESTGDLSFVGWLLFVILLIALSVWLLLQMRKRDFTTRKARVMEEERRILFDKAPCGYHSIDGQGLIINANATLLRWLGYEKGEIFSKLKFSDIVSGGSQALNERLSSMAKTKTRMIDLTLLKKTGEPMPVILSEVSIDKLDSGHGERLFSTIDNTRCHDAMERIKTLDQELEAFSYSISHDLRAPLRSIDGYSRILQEDYAERLDDEGRRVLSVVTNNAKRMGKLIDDLLTFGRLGRKPLQRSNVNMTSIVHSTVQELQAQEPGRRIQVTVSELAAASADADMLRQVWFNLMENAFKFTGKKEEPSITVRSYMLEPNEMCYEVKDNGVGFDMQYAEKLFGIFQRLHKMQDFTGTGVGLAIVKRIITRHGGRVWAESAVNDGATFYFTLPINDENA